MYCLRVLTIYTAVCYILFIKIHASVSSQFPAVLLFLNIYVLYFRCFGKPVLLCINVLLHILL